MMGRTDIADPKGLQPVVVGVKPWFPWPLSQWGWLTRPVPAERLSILRIGLAAVLVLDILLTYLPNTGSFFGRDGLGRSEVFAWMYSPNWNWDAVRDDVGNAREDMTKEGLFHRTLEKKWRWSLLRDIEDPRILRGALVALAVATVCLLVGYQTRLAAVVVWLLSTSFANLNGYIDNGGDQVRYIITLYLMLTPCGAAWSLDAWLRRRRGSLLGPARVYPWALRLLFVQMVLIYWTNGLYKVTGYDWQHGDSLYYVLGDLTLSRWSYAEFPIPYSLTRLLSWTILGWELTFPLWVCLPWKWLANGFESIGLDRPRFALWLIRHLPVIALAFGVAFHIGIGLSMELGCFVPYMLCLYLPLLPAERLSFRSRLTPAVKFT
jgi:uncharacterized membrane protein YphA (DoxX/SURF4 family)